MIRQPLHDRSQFFSLSCSHTTLFSHSENQNVLIQGLHIHYMYLIGPHNINIPIQLQLPITASVSRAIRLISDKRVQARKFWGSLEGFDIYLKSNPSIKWIPSCLVSAVATTFTPSEHVSKTSQKICVFTHQNYLGLLGPTLVRVKSAKDPYNDGTFILYSVDFL